MIGTGYRLNQTCPSHPEQYDVFDGDTQVGYLRLRDGWFRAHLRKPGGAVVYESSTLGDGQFIPEERGRHLVGACDAIRDAIEEQLKP